MNLRINSTTTITHGAHLCDADLKPLNAGGPRSGVDIGPFSRRVAEGAKWRSQERFPSGQVWADEVERLLSFLCAQSQLGRFSPRLADSARARDAALAEARVAFYFFRNRFRIVEWEPAGHSGRVGEFSISWNSGPVIFVEVKAPDWQGELEPEELRDGRKQLGRHVDYEARAVDPLPQVTKVIEKNAVPKLTEDRPNLVVIADQFFVLELDDSRLKRRIDELHDDPANRLLGGVLFFKAEKCGGEIRYMSRLFVNSHAGDQCRIPEDVASGFRSSFH